MRAVGVPAPEPAVRRTAALKICSPTAGPVGVGKPTRTVVSTALEDATAHVASGVVASSPTVASVTAPLNPVDSGRASASRDSVRLARKTGCGKSGSATSCQCAEPFWPSSLQVTWPSPLATYRRGPPPPSPVASTRSEYQPSPSVVSTFSQVDLSAPAGRRNRPAVVAANTPNGVTAMP